jgi:hypothetical protein
MEKPEAAVKKQQQWRVTARWLSIDPNFTPLRVQDPTWFNNSMHDNGFNAVQRDGTPALNLFHHLTGTVTQTNNFDLLGHLATTADEQIEYGLWQSKLSSNGIKIGP